MTDNEKKCLFNPMNELNEKKYLNEISLKYRYDLIELNKISQKLGFKNENENLFNRLVSNKSTHIDKDIRLAMKYRNNNNLYIQNQTQEPTLTSEYAALNTYNNKDNNNKDNNKDINKDNNKDNKDNNISTSHNISPRLNQIPLSPRRNKRLTVSFNEFPLKGVSIKTVNHERKFTSFFKNPLDINLNDISNPHILDSPIKRESSLKSIFTLHSIDKKNKKFKQIKKSPIKKTILTHNNSFNSYPPSNNHSHYEDSEDEYDRINIGGEDTRLFKNYLVSPTKKRNMSEIMSLIKENNNCNDVKPICKNGKISLSKLCPDDGVITNFNKKQYTLTMLRSNSGEVIYTLLKKDKGRRKNAIYTMGKVNEKDVKKIEKMQNKNIHKHINENLLPLPHIHCHNHFEEIKNRNHTNEKEIFKILKSKNENKLNQYRDDNKQKFKSVVETARNKLKSIDKEIKNILALASANMYHKLDKNKKSNGSNIKVVKKL